ncbi:HAMP domain-containing protein (plasmid) [Erwinia sp. E602]|nr:HAMP domain-containing protein [Erwinia sp. E602]
MVKTRAGGVITLWRWICTRLLSLALGGTFLIISILWLRYYLPQAWISSRIPTADKIELSRLLENPSQDINRFHQLVDKWYGLSYSDPSIYPSDWFLVGALLLSAIPVFIVVTLRAVRPISRHISRLAQVAKAVTEGDFGVRADPPQNMPQEIHELTGKLNIMSSQLAGYDKELKASHIALAHELRSPLTAAMGRLQGMIDGVFPPSQDQLATIMRQLQHLNRLTDDLHLLSLTDAGQLHLNVQKIPLDEVLREKISWLRPRLQALEFDVTLDGSPQIVCEADHFRVGQVFSILLDNALRYASEGKRLDIRYQQFGKTIVIRFKDYGPGVSEDFRGKLFLRFARAEASRSRHSGGAGLGLSIARAICLAHNGTISARNNDGAGLTFTVTLPNEHRPNVFGQPG